MNTISKAITAAVICSVGLVGCGVSHDSIATTKTSSTHAETNKNASINQPLKTEKQNDQNSPVEGTYPIISSHGMFIQYSTLTDVIKTAILIAEVKVIDQDIVSIDDAADVATRSNVEVIKTFKGDPTLTSLRITESGGLVDLSKLPKVDKPGKGHEPANLGIVDTALEGSPVMKKNQTYIVFVKQNPNPKWGYNIVGSVQGKLKIDGVSGKVLNTVDPHYVGEETFFLQKQFEGKDKSQVTNLIQSFKE
jgi:hypothetical protein